MVFVEGDDYRQLRRPGDDPAQFRSIVRPGKGGAAPDSVQFQYKAENFSTTGWPDSAPNGTNADLSVTGLTKTTLNGKPAVKSDGVDDRAESTAPAGDGFESLFGLESFGIAMQLRFQPGDIDQFVSARPTTNADFQVRQDDAPNGAVAGNIAIEITDNNNGQIRLGTQTDVSGVERTVIVNKRGNTAADIEIYVDSMSAQESVGVLNDTGFDNTAVTLDTKGQLFALQGSFNMKTTTRVMEFNTEPYSLSQRQDFKGRV
jgi:hypothetical protein